MKATACEWSGGAIGNKLPSELSESAVDSQLSGCGFRLDGHRGGAVTICWVAQNCSIVTAPKATSHNGWRSAAPGIANAPGVAVVYLRRDFVLETADRPVS
jgi:hypothetical protein